MTRSKALQCWKSGHFQKLSPPKFTMGAGIWPHILKLGHNILIWSGQIFYICYSFCVTWLWTWHKRRLWRVDRQSRTGIFIIYYSCSGSSVGISSIISRVDKHTSKYTYGAGWLAQVTVMFRVFTTKHLTLHCEAKLLHKIWSKENLCSVFSRKFNTCLIALTYMKRLVFAFLPCGLYMFCVVCIASWVAGALLYIVEVLLAG